MVLAAFTASAAHCVGQRAQAVIVSPVSTSFQKTFQEEQGQTREASIICLRCKMLAAEEMPVYNKQDWFRSRLGGARVNANLPCSPMRFLSSEGRRCLLPPPPVPRPPARRRERRGGSSCRAGTQSAAASAAAATAGASPASSHSQRSSHSGGRPTTCSPPHPKTPRCSYQRFVQCLSYLQRRRPSFSVFIQSVHQPVAAARTLCLVATLPPCCRHGRPMLQATTTAAALL